LIVPLLGNSGEQPLGATSKTVATSSAGLNKEKVWTSMTSGRDFKVRIDGDYIYTEWVNVPPQLKTTAAFMRSELKKDGDKWVGKSRSNLPHEYNRPISIFGKTVRL
jgi:hypothetical protein